MVCEYVQFWKLAQCKAHGEIFVPHAYGPGIQAQGDWYEAVVELAGEGGHTSVLTAFAERRLRVGGEFFRKVHNKGRMQVGTKFYSTTPRAGLEARVSVPPSSVEIHHEGRMVASHPRCLDLEHCLGALKREPGTMAGPKPLRQWGGPLKVAVEDAIQIGASDVAVVRYLMTPSPINCAPSALDPEEIKRSEFSTRPLPAPTAYDQLPSLSTLSLVKEVAQ
jgi:hypothetical protein